MIRRRSSMRCSRRYAKAARQRISRAWSRMRRRFESRASLSATNTAIGNALLREDRDFHTIQDIEDAFRQYSILKGTDAGAHVLIATTRYLAAHAPTARAQAQTYRIALRLNRGEQVFDEP